MYSAWLTRFTTIYRHLNLHLPRHPLYAAWIKAVHNKRFSEYLLWICMCIIWHIMTGGNSCWYAVHSDGCPDDETRVTWFIGTQASAEESQEVLPYGFSWDLTWEAQRPCSLKKTPQAHFSQVGGGSKIKSAVTVYSLDRGEHIVLELVSNTGWDLILTRKDPAGQGCSGLCVGFLAELVLFIIHYPSHLVGAEHSESACVCVEWNFVEICKWLLALKLYFYVHNFACKQNALNKKIFLCL